MRSVSRTYRSAALFVLVLAACDAGGPVADAGFEVRDSAGVRVVSNSQPEAPLMHAEVLRVGVVDGDPRYLFDGIRTLTVDPAGGFWVVDGHDAVRHYRPDGTHAGSLGGRGRGPGESEMYYSATLAGDSVLLSGVPRVLQLFDADGSLLDSAPPAGGPYQGPVGAANGRWILREQSYRDDGGLVFRSRVTFLAADALDGPSDTVAVFQGELSRVEFGEGPFRHIGRASWFHGNPAFGVDGAGRVYVSDTLRYRVETYDTGGRLVRVLERDAEPRAFDEAWLAEMEAGFESAESALAGGGAAIDRDRLGRQMEAATPEPAPPHLPFIGEILVGPDGELWAERADRHPRPAMRAVAHAYGYVRHAWLPAWAAPRLFDVFDAAGRYQGTVRLPPDYAPMAIAGDRVYGVHYDEWDVERVVVLEVGRSPGPSSI